MSESIDMIRFIDRNERRHIVESQNQLKITSQLTKYSSVGFKQHILTDEQKLFKITERLVHERQFNDSIVTAIALSEDLIFLGNSIG